MQTGIDYLNNLHSKYRFLLFLSLFILGKFSDKSYPNGIEEIQNGILKQTVNFVNSAIRIIDNLLFGMFLELLQINNLIPNLKKGSKENTNNCKLVAYDQTGSKYLDT